MVEHDLTPSPLSPSDRATAEHLRRVFPDSDVYVLPPAAGPIHDLVPALRILSLAPPEGGRLYSTAGLPGVEFLLHAPAADDPVHVETLTMAAYYHATGGDHTLGLGHTVPIGRPWVAGSACDHLLVSLPYPWGPELEAGGPVRMLWLLPITAAEKAFRHAEGLEALEQRLEDAAIIATDPHRRSVAA